MRPSEVAREELEQAASSGQNELFQKLLDVAGDMHRLKANSRPGGCDQRRDQGDGVGRGHDRARRGRELGGADGRVGRRAGHLHVNHVIMRDMPTKGARGGSAERLCNTARSRWQRSRSGFM
jgi:hypothetical protein